MTTWRRNEAMAALRRCVLNVAALADGAWAAATTDLTGKVFLRAGGASFVAAAGTLTPLRRPLVQADDTFTVDAGTDVATLATADPATGSGPFQLTTTTTLPAGLALATDYWWIRTGAKTGKFAVSLADALAGTAIDITDTGTGTHTISDTATTEQLIDGKWLYEATQGEIDVGVNEMELAVIDDTYYAQTFVAIEDTGTDYAAIVSTLLSTVMESSVAFPKAQTFLQQWRLMFAEAVLKAPDNLEGSPYGFRDINDTKDRSRYTMSAGVRTPTDLDGT